MTGQWGQADLGVSAMLALTLISTSTAQATFTLKCTPAGGRSATTYDHRRAGHAAWGDLFTAYSVQ